MEVDFLAKGENFGVLDDEKINIFLFTSIKESSAYRLPERIWPTVIVIRHQGILYDSNGFLKQGLCDEEQVGYCELAIVVARF